MKPHRFRPSSARLCVQLHHKNALPLAHRNPRDCACVFDVCILLSEHDDVSLINNRTHGSKRSLDVSIKELHVALLAVTNELQTRISFHTTRTTFNCRLLGFQFAFNQPRTSNLLLRLALVVKSTFLRLDVFRFATIFPIQKNPSSRSARRLFNSPVSMSVTEPVVSFSTHDTQLATIKFTNYTYQNTATHFFR